MQLLTAFFLSLACYVPSQNVAESLLPAINTNIPPDASVYLAYIPLLAAAPFTQTIGSTENIINDLINYIQ